MFEIDRHGRIEFQGRFDEDDFESAYGELDRRYYVGEGAAYAAGGALQTDYTIAINRADLDRVFRELTSPDFRATSRSRSVFGERSAAEFRASLEELASMVASARTWISAVRWPSPAVCVVRMEREAAGLDGERYTWTRLNVVEVRGGLVASMCEFDLDDEEAAFAYAEERQHATASRLAVANLATESERRWFQMVGRDEFEALLPLMHEQFRVDDRRAMPAAPCIGREAGIEGFRRLLADYPKVEVVPLAVRGEHLALVEWRCRTPSGFEATYLNVHAFDDAGQLAEQVRFDGDDFEGAYRELEQRYCAGEGESVAKYIALQTDFITAMNCGDLDKVFGDLTTSDFRIESRSRSVFGDRSRAEVRSGFEELGTMVADMRTWISAVRWPSPDLSVARVERKALGQDGERYAWTWLHVAEARDGRVASMCTFELEDEQRAFAYTEERAGRGS